MISQLFSISFATVQIFLSTDYNTTYDWQLLDDKYWQPMSLHSEPPNVTEEYENTQGACPSGMVEVNGLMKQDPNPGLFSGRSIDALQKQTCTHWLNREPISRDRCKTYDRDKWLQISFSLKSLPKKFCIDRFESGVNKGEFPIIMINYREAGLICKARGTRLCTESEWNFACEGPEAIPYPYGYTRDDTACVIDKPWRAYSSDLFPRNTIKSLREVDKLWQGEPAGSRSRCKSVFGVYDLTGNVDELTTSNIYESKYKSTLKGGYWGGAVRNRCRAATRSHDESFAFYQVSFRCCKDLL